MVAHKKGNAKRKSPITNTMSSGGGGFFNQFTPWGGGGGGGAPGVTTEVALEGDRITVNPKGLEEDGEGSPLRMPQSMITSTMPGHSSRTINTPLYVTHLAMLNTKPGNDLFFIWMAPLP
jgi:hypothetical protein